jgi:hypothetical protein
MNVETGYLHVEGTPVDAIPVTIEVDSADFGIAGGRKASGKFIDLAPDVLRMCVDTNSRVRFGCAGKRYTIKAYEDRSCDISWDW